MCSGVYSAGGVHYAHAAVHDDDKLCGSVALLEDGTCGGGQGKVFLLVNIHQ